jgi:hypothetical protein
MSGGLLTLCSVGQLVLRVLSLSILLAGLEEEVVLMLFWRWPRPDDSSLMLLKSSGMLGSSLQSKTLV